MVVVNENPLEMKVFTIPGQIAVKKHKRHSRPNTVDLHSNYGTSWLLQKQFEHRLNYLEERLPAIFRSNTSTTDPPSTSLQERTAKLESSVSDVMTRIEGQEKLHASMLELLESVEDIEAKFDSVTPDLRREISKLEFAFSQITSNAPILQENQVCA